ncbi:MAG TPA: hypothetical protein VM901_02995 [Bdellovibrionota bacterium]|jgi:hypothetical protein|nr:hypothetical protein [Bdellovibrionota bacterium]
MKDLQKIIALTLSLSMLTPAYAQSATLNEQIKAVDRQYQNQIQDAQGALSRANMQMTQCGMTYNKGADGKAHPDLDEAPDGTANMMQAMIPALTQAAPALTEVMGNLGSASSDADRKRERAINNYNNTLADMDQFGGKIPSQYTVSDDEKDPDAVPDSADLRRVATRICSNLETEATSDPTKITRVNRCYDTARDVASAALRLENELDLAKNSNTATQQLAGAALTAAATGFMAHSQNAQNEKDVQKQNEIATRTANQNLQMCEMDAKSEIDNTKRRLAQLELDRADQLRDLALQNAMAMNEINNGSIDDDANEGKTLPPINPGAPNPTKAKDSAVAQAPAAGGGGGAAGGAPGAGGSSGGTPTWNFDGAPGNYLGGGLPTPEGGAMFAGAGGGGVFSGGFGQEDGMDLSAGQGAGLNAMGSAAERGLASIGDGGLQVMMARMRIRIAYHAGELMQGSNLKSVAQKDASPADTASPAADRMPASKF